MIRQRSCVEVCDDAWFLWRVTDAESSPQKLTARSIFDHLLQRVQERQISRDQLVMMLQWLDSEPEVPDGKWFKRFPKMSVCGEGELVKTLLGPDRAPLGDEVS